MLNRSLIFICLSLLIEIEGAILKRNFPDCSIDENGMIDYRGKHDRTKSNRLCLPWTRVSPSSTIWKFPNDETTEDAMNFCRNPNRTSVGPWCFVEKVDRTVESEICDLCPNFVEKTSSNCSNPSFGNFVANPIDCLSKSFDSVRTFVSEKAENLVEPLKENFDFLQSQWDKLKFF